ncbi:Saccharopine dehydrogenase [NAD(+), L-lysine-forming] [Stylophora pistillata]|uniref:Saccharopine dehydrogenase [NAD(+), L-lysine-forming] n=1 Tax=Stylophora pistillata TaxID=50429 RepID=A0A2B4T0Z8_STYPI|nr:Saccharopine dehydrogenase [NAD(+), L-lysine-forming] [Stylophora pistillata]
MHDWSGPRIPLIKIHKASRGHQVFVEKSKDRVYKEVDYERVGCKIVEEGSWSDAPTDAYIVGIKELPNEDRPLKHPHIYFGHAFKGQDGWCELLQRFHQGGGELLDVEFIVNDSGKREVAEFGPMAGIAGAALSIAVWCHQQLKPNEMFPSVTPYMSEDDMVNHMKSQLQLIANERGKSVLASVDGCSGNIVKWTRQETQGGGPFPAILSYDVFINCILLSKKIPPFLTKEMVQNNNRNLTVISDVSCDCTSPDNPLPIYDTITTFVKPTHRLDMSPSTKLLDVIAIDHLPSLLPQDSSDKYAAKLLPFLFKLPEASTYPPWVRVKNMYREKLKEALAGIEIRTRKESVARDKAELSSSSSESDNV